MTQEKRRFERFGARFPAKFKDTREEFGQKVCLRDASAAGIRFMARQEVQVYDTVALEVKLPEERVPMSIRGEVVWVKEREKNLWDVGVNIHDINLMKMARLYKHIIS